MMHTKKHPLPAQPTKDLGKHAFVCLPFQPAVFVQACRQ